MNQTLKQDNLLTIGQLSRLTGISTFTLRMWEKRYGTPEAQRLPSGHRRYPREEVPRLRAIAKALDSGYRAGKVVCGTMEELQNLPGVQLPLSSRVSRIEEPHDASSNQSTIDQWMEAVHRFDEDALTQGYFETWARHGSLEFVLNFAIPFIYRIGNEWEAGERNVSQEHFASERLGHFLSGKWRQANARKQGPTVVMTTLPGDPHRLGVQMCCVVTSLIEARIVYLGPDTPLKDILSAVEKSRAPILCISVVPTMDPVTVEKYLSMLKKKLNKTEGLVVGGSGATDAIPGIIRFNNFKDYLSWLNTRSNGKNV